MAGRYVSEIEIKANIQQSLNQIAELQGKIERIGSKGYKINLGVQSQQLEKVIGNLEKMLDSLGKGMGDFKQFENLSKELSSVVSEVQSLSKAFGKLDDSGAKTLLSSIHSIDKSLDELSQNILNVNKNMSNMGSNTNGVVKQVENIRNVSVDAVKQVDKLADAQSKLGNKTNISSVDTPSKLNKQELQILLEQQVSQYNLLIAKAQKYGNETSDIVSKLKEQRDLIAQVNKDGVYTAKSNLKADDYYSARNNYKVNKAHFDSYESSIKNFDKEWQNLLEIDNAINHTKELIDSITVPSGFESSFDSIKAKVEQLNKDLASGEISVKDYGNAIKSALSGFNDSIGEREKQVWNDLTKSLQRYSTVKQRIASGKAFGTDNEEATKLLEHIHELQRSDILSKEKLNSSNEKLHQIDQTVTDLKAKLKETTIDSVQNSIDKYKKAFATYNKRPIKEQSEDYQNNLVDFSKNIEQLESLKNTIVSTNELTEEQIQTFERLTSKCEESTNAFKNMSAAEKGAKEISIGKAIQRINKDLEENTRYSKQAKDGLKALLRQLESGDPSINVEKITSEIIKLENAEIAAGRAGKSLWDVFKSKSVYGFIGQIQSYLSMYVGFYGMVNAVKKTVSTVVELDTALVDLKKTTTMNSSELENFYYDSNNVAKQMGVTTEEIIDQASAWSRLNKIGLLYGDI